MRPLTLTLSLSLSAFLFPLLLVRRVSVVNLDPANDSLPYKAAIDLKDLITIEEVMETMQLGPNGGKIHVRREGASCCMRRDVQLCA